MNYHAVSDYTLYIWTKSPTVNNKIPKKKMTLTYVTLYNDHISSFVVALMLYIEAFAPTGKTESDS
jgi:hypothetical protein